MVLDIKVDPSASLTCIWSWEQLFSAPLFAIAKQAYCAGCFQMDSVLVPHDNDSSVVYLCYYVSQTKGEKGTIILLHGFPEYADMWADQIKIFERLGYTCIAPDLLGYGRNFQAHRCRSVQQWRPKPRYCRYHENWASRECIFIGHDWGCYLAGRFGLHCCTLLHLWAWKFDRNLKDPGQYMYSQGVQDFDLICPHVCISGNPWRRIMVPFSPFVCET